MGVSKISESFSMLFCLLLLFVELRMHINHFSPAKRLTRSANLSIYKNGVERTNDSSSFTTQARSQRLCASKIDR